MVSGISNFATITSVNSSARNWSDANQNYVLNCVLENFDGNGECGAISDANFGKVNPKATTFADNLLHGWSNRPQFWEWGMEVQHQLASGLSMNAGYVHNWVKKGFIFTDNIQGTPAGFTLSANFQNVPGPEILAAYQVPTSEILPVLGRNLAACGTRVACSATATVPLIEPRTRYEDRPNNLDLRLAKSIRVS